MCDATIPYMLIALALPREPRDMQTYFLCAFSTIHNNEKLNIKYMMTVVASVCTEFLATEFPSGVNVGMRKRDFE